MLVCYLDKELVIKVSKKFAILEEAAREYVRSRQQTVDLLQGLADDLSMHHRNAQAAKVPLCSKGGAPKSWYSQAFEKPGQAQATWPLNLSLSPNPITIQHNLG